MSLHFVAMQDTYLAQCFLQALHHGVLETCSLHRHPAMLCIVWLPPLWKAPVQALGAHFGEQMEEDLLLMPSDVHESALCQVWHLLSFYVY